MEIIENNKERVVLRMEANDSLANAIRRSVSEVPTLAIDEVEIFKNDSALYDEIVAHRLGLVPLKTEKSMNKKTKIEFKLSKKGPCTVYSGDLDGVADVIYKNIPITILGKEQKLELVATANLGIALEHAKYLPGLCYYRHIIEVKTGGQIDKIVEQSKGIFKAEKKGNKWLCDLTDAEIEAIEKIDKEAIKDSEEIIFIVESYGNMPAKDILFGAIEAINHNLAEVEKEVK